MSNDELFNQHRSFLISNISLFLFTFLVVIFSLSLSPSLSLCLSIPLSVSPTLLPFYLYDDLFYFSTPLSISLPVF